MGFTALLSINQTKRNFSLYSPYYAEVCTISKSQYSISIAKPLQERRSDIISLCHGNGRKAAITQRN